MYAACMLLTDSRFAARRGSESDCSDFDFLDWSSESSESSERPEARVMDQQHKGDDYSPNLDVRRDTIDVRESSPAWSSCQDCGGGSLLFQFFERVPPHARPPFFTKVFMVQYVRAHRLSFKCC